MRAKPLDLRCRKCSFSPPLAPLWVAACNLIQAHSHIKVLLAGSGGSNFRAVASVYGTNHILVSGTRGKPGPRLGTRVPGSRGLEGHEFPWPRCATLEAAMKPLMGGSALPLCHLSARLLPALKQ
jgi:hypothetical protein